MRKDIDAKGLACPKPVILTKKELDSITTGSVRTEVDNDVAKENLSKLATSMGFEFQVETIESNRFAVTIFKDGVHEKADGSVEKKTDIENNVIVIQSDQMGKGSEELGKILIKSFIYTLKETKPFPKSILFYNSGVLLTCEGSGVIDDLKSLEENGVEIISCGTCLDYYKLKEKLLVGSISNMYTIYETLKNSSNTITIG